MRVLIIGQCTLHWGRMEFGNVGNYYIVDPLFAQLRRIYPGCQIVTTMQFSTEFCNKYNIETLPMEIYYNFGISNNLPIAEKEYKSVVDGEVIVSQFVNEVKASDLVIDFSGDIWGENADFLGNDRFAVGCYKDLTAQILKPTIMIAGSPGPFATDTMEFAKKAYAGFDFVINREPISTKLLKDQGFDLSNTMTYPCPSFMFKAADRNKLRSIIDEYSLDNSSKIKIGLILCGWNFEKGPFDLWPRVEKEYECFVKMVEAIVRKYNCVIYLLSHSNGFEMTTNKFELIHGRDYPILEHFRKILLSKGMAKDQLILMEGKYLPDITKGIIANFDVLISGRLHGAIAGISQGVPTVIIDYGHEPKAHKLRGFAEVADVSEYIVDPKNTDDMILKVEKCIANKKEIHEKLEEQMRLVNQQIIKQFDYIKEKYNYD